MSVDYASEKLAQAVYVLAVGVDRVQGRLADAWSQGLSYVPRADLPEDLRAMLDDIRARLLAVTSVVTAERRLGPVGTLSDEEAGDIARTIVSLDHQLRSALEGRRGSGPVIVDDPKRWQRRPGRHPAGG